MKKRDFEEIYLEDYPSQCIINGNLSECVRYLTEIAQSGVAGVMTLTEEMVTIKINFPDRYEYITGKVFKWDLLNPYKTEVFKTKSSYND